MSAPSNQQRCVNVALIQMTCGTSKDANVRKAIESIERAAQRGANVICLQELFHDPYPCQSEDHQKFLQAEPIPGPTTELLSEAAKKCGVVVVGCLFERRAPGLYHNTAVVLDADGRLAGRYRKMHIPDDPFYFEKFYFTPGDLGFSAFETRFGKIGVCICWDQWFPEAARLTALAGAEILFYPTAIGWLLNEREQFGASQHRAWETMMCSHAIANGIYVAAANRVGREENLQFWGASFVVDPYGNLLHRASHDNEEIVIAACDLNIIDTARTHWPFLRDRRIDAYSGLLKRHVAAD